MATLNVPGTYPTIAAALAAAQPTDTVLISASYAGDETVTVNVNNVTFSAPSAVTGIVLNATQGIQQINLADVDGTGGSSIKINGNTDNNVITGNSGANYLTDGGGGDDTLNGGGSGDDIFTVTGGLDSIFGGASSNDLLIIDYSSFSTSVTNSYGTSSDRSAFTSGTSTVTFAGVERLHVLGGFGDDSLDGGSGDDILDGGFGNDILYAASGGVDTLKGGAGDDTFEVNGGIGEIYGGTGFDLVRANDLGAYSFLDVEKLDLSYGNFVYATTAQLAGFDLISTDYESRLEIYIIGSDGAIDFTDKIGLNNYVYINGVDSAYRYSVTGSNNGDEIFGTNFDDFLNGGGGSDTLLGGRGNDTLDGGAGNDFLDGEKGTDTLRGGAGNDTLVVYADGSGTVDGGSDGDTVQAEDNLGDVSFLNVENLNITSYQLGATIEQLNSFSGIYSTIAESGSYVIFNLSGAGGAINFADKGFNRQLPVWANGQTLTSAADITGGNSFYFGDYIHGSAFNDVIRGGAADDILEGGDGNDKIEGGTDNDMLCGGNGNDTLDGGTGNDTLDGGGGRDRLFGGSGDDIYIVGNAGVLVTEVANAGTDTVRAVGNYTLSANVENLVLTGASGNGIGNSLSNTLIGNDGNNVLDGKAGADRLEGGLGNDTYVIDSVGDVIVELSGQGNDTVRALISYTMAANTERLEVASASNISGTGNAGANTIVGSIGANTLTGLGGKDTLTGGAGRDIFVFTSLFDSTVATTGRDTITDFRQSEGDRIDLRPIDAVDGLEGNQNFTWIGTAGFAGSAGQLRYQESGVNTLISGDVDGNGAADFAILLAGQIALTSGNFLL